MARPFLLATGALAGAFALFLGGWYALRKARPCGPLSPQKEANIRAFDLPDAASYDRAATRFLSRVYRAIALDLVERVGDEAVLDVGAGPGHLAAELARLRPRLQVRGVDLMPEMVMRARARAAAADLADRLEFVQGEASALPFADETFAVVTSSFSMHHWEDVRAGLVEIERVLQPGGRAFLYDLPGWFLRLAAHQEDTSDPGAGSIFAGVRDGRLRWPLRVPFLRRLELVKRAADGRGAAVPGR